VTEYDWRATRGPGLGHRTRFSPEVQEEVIDLYTVAFNSLNEIVELGRHRLDWPASRSGVLGILWANNIKPRKRSWGARNRHLPAHHVKLMVRLYEEGMTVGELAKRLGKCDSTVSQQLSNAGVVKRPKSPIAHLRPRIEELREEGLGWAAIGRELGCGPDAVRRLILGRDGH
jgi:transposase-like protein